MITFNPEPGIQEYIKDELKKFGHRYDDKLNWEDNFLIAYSLTRKIPASKPRFVIELPNITVPPHLISGYNSLKKNIINGVSLKGHLSTKTAKFKFHDLLLNYWNIHHLHLSTEKYKNGFFERTGYVVFCLIYDNAVIIIDILPHPTAQNDGWFNIDLIEKIHKFVPDALQKFKTNHITGHTLTASQRNALHSNHTNYAMRLNDGTVYYLGGVMSNGISFNDMIQLMHLQVKIDYFDNVVRLNNDDLAKVLSTTDCELTIAIDNDECILYSPKHSTGIRINDVKNTTSQF